ncbi:Guanylate kinase [Candidatus Clavichlamydia salmonicola]|uniref:guanylate kinase n=1 Tax=Candidatus Clavichlamydia salmonicola TaxID=469812 RepID=UPI001891D4BA|nr:guanylate kinase [Candidatus Clavichlamydia salmonicola]MBF5050838.1 Guanylate kinase [Candidatus Clavichlamydia salmonicola]
MKTGLFGSSKNPKIFVISAPAGTGKSTLTAMLLKEFSLDLEETCSCTTRAPRNGEKEGLNYYFLSEEEFTQREKEGEFIETVYLFSAKYGTLKGEILRILNKNKHVVAVLDVKGALAIKKAMPVVTIFIAPPSIEEQKRRLLARNTEQSEMLLLRLNHAPYEIRAAAAYDYYVENSNLEKAYQILRSIFIAEGHKQGKANNGN